VGENEDVKIQNRFLVWFKKIQQKEKTRFRSLVLLVRSSGGAIDFIPGGICSDLNPVI